MAKKSFILIFVFLFSILLSSVVFSEYDDVFSENTEINLHYPCENNNAPCSASSSCNITIQYPNRSVFILNQPMTNNYPSELHNYSITTPTTYGEYITTVRCVDGGDYGREEYRFYINKYGVKENPLSIFGGIIALIIMTSVYIYSAFNLKDKNIIIKYGLYILSFVNIIAGVVIAKLMNNNYYSINNVLDIMITINVLVVSYTIYKIIKDSIMRRKYEEEKEYR